MTPASHHDSPYLPLCVAYSCHTKEPIKKVFADKGYFGKPNREFLAMNKIEDGIMRKATTGTELTEYETARNKAISKVRYINGLFIIFLTDSETIHRAELNADS